jgi:hypothetical protein
VPGIAAIGLGFAHHHRADLGGLADEERMARAVPGSAEATSDVWLFS